MQGLLPATSVTDTPELLLQGRRGSDCLLARLRPPQEIGGLLRSRYFKEGFFTKRSFAAMWVKGSPRHSAVTGATIPGPRGGGEAELQMPP